MFWKIQNGIIYTKRLEINVVHHCNLSCRGCSHLSPRLPKYFVSPDKLLCDLTVLSKYCRPERISLIGGEPLLHPDLPEIMNIVRKSGISDKIRVVTNGILLNRMPDQFWKNVDEVVVSLYPNHPMQVKDLAVFKKHTKKFATSIELRYQDHFSEAFLETCNANDALVKRIYQTCTAPRAACCHTLYEGYYYKCPKSVFIPLAYNERYNGDVFDNGVRITESNKSADALLKYLSAEEPLKSCRYCLGSVGKRFTPEQTDRRNIPQISSPEEMIDRRRLENLESKRGLPHPVWLQSALQKTNAMISALPPWVLLSPILRRSVTTLSDIKRKYLK
ncbi:MAG: radical SAM protein [Desulfosalsimonadaceae bacterium]